MISTFSLEDASIEQITKWYNTRVPKGSRHWKNYIDINFNSDFKAISVETHDNDITCISSVYHRDFYPDDCARILNRWFVPKEHRIGSKSLILSSRAKQMINQQIKFCENQYKCFFITYHSYIPRWCNLLVNELNQQTPYSWKHEKLVLIAPDPKSKTCYQHVVYTELEQSTIDNLLNNKISYEQWKKL